MIIKITETMIFLKYAGHTTSYDTIDELVDAMLTIESEVNQLW